MAEDVIVTRDQLRQLIRDERLTPADLFDADALRELTRAAEARGYAEAIATGKATDGQDKGAAEAQGDDKYTDPATNPLIRTDE